MSKHRDSETSAPHAQKVEQSSSIHPVALVTGAAKRVGRAISLALAEAGYDIGLHFRTSYEDAQRTSEDIQKKGRRCALVQADLADEASWPGTIEQIVGSLGRLDVLVNNASEFDPCHPKERSAKPPGFDTQEWDRMFRVNATAPAALCHFARAHLEHSGHGRIVNLGDVAAERPWPDYLSYCCSKAALVTLTRGLAKGYAPRITVNGVAPGIAEFPNAYAEELCRKLVAQVPLRRAGTPEEVAELVRYLVESGDYVTGQVIAIDGGRSII